MKSNKTKLIGKAEWKLPQHKIDELAQSVKTGSSEPTPSTETNTSNAAGEPKRLYSN